MSLEQVQELLQEIWKLVLTGMKNVLRQGLPGEPLALVKPMRLRWRPFIHATKDGPRVSPPGQRQWLSQLMAILEHAGLAYYNM